MRSSSNPIIRFTLISLIFLNAIYFSQQISAENSCNPTKPNSLNVHIISHTHLDTGWVKTFKEYYNQSVNAILNTVIQSLTSNEGLESRVFSFVEISYFNLYWNDIDDKQKNILRKLIVDRKLQFVSGGWAMNDEASPHYSMIIDNMALGHQWINRTFGKQYLPTTGWQVDPFGHSTEFASILSQMGFNGLFVGRIDFQDFNRRESTQTMELIWKTDPHLKSSNYMFTSVLPTGYNPIPGFCYDPFCLSAQVINPDFETSSLQFIDIVKSQSKKYVTNHLIATMGGDFFYANAKQMFQYLDTLIKTVNSKQKEVHLLYSTPDCYLKSLNSLNKSWTDIKYDDFFPYADFPNDYWSGFYSSRPSFKYSILYANNFLQVSKQLIAVANIYSSASEYIKPLQESVAIVSHHDAITGTSKQYVIEEYTRMLDNGIFTSQKAITKAFQKLLNTTLEPNFCHHFNRSQCLYTETVSDTEVLQITVYNPLIHKLNHYLSLPIAKTDYEITDSEGKVIKTQIEEIPRFFRNINERNSTAKYYIYFEAVIPPLSFVTYFMKKVHKSDSSKIEEKIDPEMKDDVIVSNNKIKITINKSNGLLKSIEMNNQTVDVSQNFYFHTTKGSHQKNSGSYAMHTNGLNATLISPNASVSVIRGELVEEIRQVFTPWLSQVIRLYRNNTDYIEFDWIVGPLHTDHDMEIVTRFDTSFKTEGIFYTDSNGRQTIKRIRNFRPTWNWTAEEKVASNYYPTNSWLYIRDPLRHLQLTVLPDRPQGGSSLKDGSIELMIHRRLGRDDHYGMEEALDEKGFDGKGLVVRGKHILMINQFEDSVKIAKRISKQIYLQPLSMFTIVPKPSIEKSPIILNHEIDDYLHLLTFEELSENNIC